MAQYKITVGFSAHCKFSVDNTEYASYVLFRHYGVTPLRKSAFSSATVGNVTLNLAVFDNEIPSFTGAGYIPMHVWRIAHRSSNTGMEFRQECYHYRSRGRSCACSLDVRQKIARHTTAF